jgi:transposase-like protein
MELISPGSIVEIEVEGNKKQRFKMIFVALKPCVEGFLAGCRPFVQVDATCLNGKYTGQLASATTVDGHNWLYHLAYAIFDSDIEDNWKWFMEQLHRAIGSSEGLVICTNACKGLESAVGVVFSQAEYRECMRHLYSNFMKHY